MKLWLLRPRENLPIADDPWEPWYNKCFGMVIRAATEKKAREMAASNKKSPRGLPYPKPAGDEGGAPWLDQHYSTCTELDQSGEPEVIMTDVHSA